MAIIFIRTFIVFLSILGAMRLMGKRQLGELELSELVVAVLISDMAALPLQDLGVPLLYGLIPLITLLCCELLLSALTLKNIKIRALLCGKPSILIQDGIINQKEMAKNRFTLDELMESLRAQGCIDISKIKLALLETNGTLCILLYPSEYPPSAKELNIDIDDNGIPTIIIDNGRIIDENLKVAGLNHNWLFSQLKKRGISAPNEVYFMTVDRNKNVYFSAKDKVK